MIEIVTVNSMTDQPVAVEPPLPYLAGFMCNQSALVTTDPDLTFTLLRAKAVGESSPAVLAMGYYLIPGDIKIPVPGTIWAQVDNNASTPISLFFTDLA